MEDRRTDRRIRKTRAQLRSALTELLQEKGTEEITVTELTRRADVNRGTFYRHYKDVEDMVEQLETEMFREFSTLMDSYTASALRQGLGDILTDVFSFIFRNLDLVALVLRQRQRSLFLERFREVIREKVSREWSGLYRFESAAQQEYYLTFAVGGVVGMVQRWAESGAAETPEAMAALAEKMILQGMAPLVAQR